MPESTSDLTPRVNLSAALLEELRAMRSQVSLLQQQGDLVTRRLAQLLTSAPTHKPPVEWQARIAEIEMTTATLRPELDRLRAELSETQVASPRPVPPPDEDMTELVRSLTRELADLRADSYRLFTQNPPASVNTPGAGLPVASENRKRRYRRSASVMSVWQSL